MPPAVIFAAAIAVALAVTGLPLALARLDLAQRGEQVVQERVQSVEHVGGVVQ